MTVKVSLNKEIPVVEDINGAQPFGTDDGVNCRQKDAKRSKDQFNDARTMTAQILQQIFSRFPINPFW